MNRNSERMMRHLPVGTAPTWMIVEIPRVECRGCHLVRQIDTGISDERRSYTRSFARYVVELSRHMTIQDVSEHLCVSWDIVKDILSRHLERHYSRPKLKKAREIAVDEICIGRGFRYVTIVLDLRSGAVLFVGEGKKAESLDPFWRRLRASRARVRAVAMDMSGAYIKAVTEHLPHATIVFDHFHVIKLMNEQLSQLRRDLYHETMSQTDKRVLKGTRWLLLKHPDNLDPNRDERKRLKMALRLNKTLAIAYYLKEDLRQIWEQPNKARARTVFQSWCRQANESGIARLQRVAKTLQKHQHGILAWYDYPISTGPLEGTNNKIKTMQRQHYGFRDKEFFKLKIYALHDSKYALVG
jgi:transposase